MARRSIIAFVLLAGLVAAAAAARGASAASAAVPRRSRAALRCPVGLDLSEADVESREREFYVSGWRGGI